MKVWSIHGVTEPLLAPRPITRYASSAVIAFCEDPLLVAVSNGTTNTIACTGPTTALPVGGYTPEAGQLRLSGTTMTLARSGAGAVAGAVQGHAVLAVSSNAASAGMKNGPPQV